MGLKWPTLKSDHDPTLLDFGSAYQDNIMNNSVKLYGNKRPMHHDSLTWVKHHCISADAMQHSSSIATASRTEICMCLKQVKGHHRIIIWTNLVDLPSLMLYTKIQPQCFLGSGEEDFKYFFCFFFNHMAAILFNNAEPFGQIDYIPLRQKVPCEIWWNWSSSFREQNI